MRACRSPAGPRVATNLELPPLPSKPSIHILKWGRADGRPAARLLGVLALLANFTYTHFCHFGPRLLRSSAWLLSVNFGSGISRLLLKASFNLNAVGIVGITQPPLLWWRA